MELPPFTLLGSSEMESAGTPACATCLKEEDVKPKSGIHPCVGCQVGFCLTHLTAHRQELSRQLDQIVNQRNELYDTILNNPDPSTDRMIAAFEEVNRWRERMHGVM